MVTIDWNILESLRGRRRRRRSVGAIQATDVGHVRLVLTDEVYVVIVREDELDE